MQNGGVGRPHPTTPPRPPSRYAPESMVKAFKEESSHGKATIFSEKGFK